MWPGGDGDGCAECDGGRGTRQGRRRPGRGWRVRRRPRWPRRRGWWCRRRCQRGEAAAPGADPAAVAAGALRATLLAQIDRFEEGLGRCAAGTPVPVCSGAVLQGSGALDRRNSRPMSPGVRSGTA
ncbi:MAG: hypothetical protein U0232_21115 [Thermomicrobiales bacterium]